MMNLFRRSMTRQVAFHFFETKLTPDMLLSLKQQYLQKPSFSVFEEHITNHSDYFKIFNLVQKLPFHAESYKIFR